MLYEFYKGDLIEQGFVNNEPEHSNLVSQMNILEANPNNKAIAWQLNIEQDILNINIRALEIANWLKHLS